MGDTESEVAGWRKVPGVEWGSRATRPQNQKWTTRGRQVGTTAISEAKQGALECAATCN